MGNSLIAHVSRAVSHIWVMVKDINEAREIVHRFLKAERWKFKEEKETYLLTQEKIDALGEEEMSHYQTAQQEGLKAKFYYWHRAE